MKLSKLFLSEAGGSQVVGGVYFIMLGASMAARWRDEALCRGGVFSLTQGGAIGCGVVAATRFRRDGENRARAIDGARRSLSVIIERLNRISGHGTC